MVEPEMRYCDGCRGWFPVAALQSFEGLSSVLICEVCQMVWRQLFDACMWAACETCSHVWQEGEGACPECGTLRTSRPVLGAAVHCVGCGALSFELSPFDGLPTVLVCCWCQGRWRNIYRRAVMAYCPICSHEWQPDEMRCPCCRMLRQREEMR